MRAEIEGRESEELARDRELVGLWVVGLAGLLVAGLRGLLVRGLRGLLVRGLRGLLVPWGISLAGGGDLVLEGLEPADEQGGELGSCGLVGWILALVVSLGSRGELLAGCFLLAAGVLAAGVLATVA